MHSKHRQKPVRQLTETEARKQAEARLRRLDELKADAPVAMREYRQGEQKLRERTAKLRAERLVREGRRKS
jgi:hypothetical protein